ncbi:MAG: hypothetical protein AAF998_02780 [Bacteroidota bacterium]
MQKDKYLVCQTCKKALCLGGLPHSNVILLFLFDHQNHALTYVPEDHLAVQGCDVFLEYIFHDPKPAFHVLAQ